MSTNTGDMMTASQMLTAKRLKGELQKLEKEREAYYQVVQDEKDPLLFYFLLRGASDSVYKGGYYIGKIVLPKDYPTNPGDFYMLTPSGRFNVNAKICLTNSGYHKESWTPMWNISNMVIGFVSVFLSDTTSGISHITETPAERKAKAANSMQYNLSNHKDICSRFDQYVKSDGTVRTDKEVEEFVKEKVSKFKKVKKVNVPEDAPEDKVKVVKKASTKSENVIVEAKVPVSIAEKPIAELPEKVKTLGTNPIAKIVDDKVVDNELVDAEEVEEVEVKLSTKATKTIPAQKEGAKKTTKVVETVVEKETTKKHPVKKVIESEKEAKPQKKGSKESSKTPTLAMKDVKKIVDEDPQESDEDEKSITIGKKPDVPVSQAIVASKSKNNEVDKVMDDVAKDIKKNAKDVPHIPVVAVSKKENIPVTKTTSGPAQPQPIKVINKTVSNQPKSYNEWKRMIAEATIRTHDPKLFNMMF